MFRFTLALLLLSGCSSWNDLRDRNCDGSDCIDAAMQGECAWCSVGSTACRNGGPARCEAAAECAIYQPSTACPSGETCSFGVCSNTCRDECSPGEARCAGPKFIEVCGQNDGDSCLDWVAPMECSDGGFCSNGECAASCRSECVSGEVSCRDGGLSTCLDSNADGCTEWNPPALCEGGTACQGRAGAPGAGGVAACVATPQCVDECTEAICSELSYRTCANFDADPCLEYSAAQTCARTDACHVAGCGGDGCSNTPVACNTAPEATCLSATMQRVYDPVGACSIESGNCTYTHRDIACRACPSGCGDLCAGLTCAPLPEVAARDEVCFVRGSGTCTDGTCNYSYQNGSCDDGNLCTVGDLCSNGLCTPGSPVVCETPPASTCIDAFSIREYAPTGSCQSGACQYSASTRICPYGCERDQCRTVPLPDTLLSASYNHTCAIRSGRVACWGLGTSGQLGDGRSLTSTTPVYASGISDAIAVSAGFGHTCALHVSGRVSCWGMGGLGRLGNGGTTSVSAPVQVSNLTDAVAVAAGGTHSCAIRSTGQVVCWGSDANNQLGDAASRSHSAVPLLVGAVINVIQLAKGSGHTCARLASGLVTCWGDNTTGQLGRGNANPFATPSLVTTTEPSWLLSSGMGDFTCSFGESGIATCWGAGANFVLGNGGTADAVTPLDVPAFRFAAALTTGAQHACLLQQNGAVACWGVNTDRQIGDGTTNTRTTPTVVATGMAAVSVGVSHSCALSTTGTIYCWGDSSSGKLGFAAPGDVGTPTALTFP